MKIIKTLTILLFGFIFCADVCAQNSKQGKLAPKPVFRDPVYDGAADPGGNLE